MSVNTESDLWLRALLDLVQMSSVVGGRHLLVAVGITWVGPVTRGVEEVGRPAPTSNTERFDFYARQHICYSAYMLWQFRLSVCLSVRLSVTRVDQSKTVEARITQFSPYSSPIPLVFRG